MSASPSTANSALQPIAVLVGEWDMELSNGAFLPSLADTVKGHVSFKWVEDGAYIVYQVGAGAPGGPGATMLIGRDESFPHYQVLYYDNRKVSRVYQMSFSDGVWKMWRQAPGFSQRFEGKLSADGNTITAQWDKSSDGSHWEHDFDLKYTRVK